MQSQRIIDYTVVRGSVLFDAGCNSTFAKDVQVMIDRGYHPYGKPILTPEFCPGFTDLRIVGYQTMVKYATGT